MPLTLGLLLDSHQVPAWQYTIIESINKEPSLQISVVVFNQSDLRSASTNRWVYRLLRKADRTLFKVKHDQFARRDLTGLLEGIATLAVNPRHTKHKDEIQSDDIEWIRHHQPDVLIRFGFRILTGAILQVAKHGVWSLHHGDSAVNRGGPPAFWEVVNNEPITGVTLQVLSEKLDAGIVLGKAYCKTDRTSFNRNQNSVYAAGLELFISRLMDFARQGPEEFMAQLKPEDATFAKTLYCDPTNIKALRIALRFGWRRFGEWLTQLFYREQWVIYYHHKPDFPFSFKEATPLMASDLSDWADPFVYHHQGIDYIFFESLNGQRGLGEIKCYPIDQFTVPPIRVLEESYHLSYPTITEYQNQLYLLVESAAAKTVMLYECRQFPHRWQKLKPLLEGVELFDPTLYQHDGVWYLFGTQKPVAGASADMYLHIYFSTDLLNGEWTPHPMNPLTRDVRGARPAGRIFNFQGRLIRPAQVGTPKYGYGVRFYDIIKLSPTEFIEKRFDDMVPWLPNMLATHTYSSTGAVLSPIGADAQPPHCFVTDAQVRRFRFF